MFRLTFNVKMLNVKCQMSLMDYKNEHGVIFMIIKINDMFSFMSYGVLSLLFLCYY